MAEMKEKTAAEPNTNLNFLKVPLWQSFWASAPRIPLQSPIWSLQSFLTSGTSSWKWERDLLSWTRQQHIVTDTEDYYIDLVFYNIELKCYVLIDLKMGTITHQDVGQIDMYVRMYDELKCKEGDNPTIGILLCGETSEDIARYSVLHDNDHLFMSKYLTYLPTKEQLRAEIERQKNIFYMQHPKLDDTDNC